MIAREKVLMTKSSLLALLFLPLAACATTPSHEQLANTKPIFSPNAFFSGGTVGEGTLKVILSGTKHTHVVGHGRVDPDRTLVLVQHVQQGGEAPTTRTWHTRRVGDGRYAGTLSDAEGPVTVMLPGTGCIFASKAKMGGIPNR